MVNVMVFGFLRRMFGSDTESGGAESAEVEAFDYKGYQVKPAPRKEAAGWRVAGSIIQDAAGGTPLRHEFIRADVFPGLDEAIEITSLKAKRLIDEQGERLFRDRG